MVNLEAGHQWRPDGEPLIDYLQLISRLQSFANQLTAIRGGTEKIIIVGIDMSREISESADITQST